MDINQTLENLRGIYQGAGFDIKDCNANPIEQFDLWLEHAIETKCDEPNAFVLSTVENNQPHARVVLLKGIHENQFVFYTNYNSAKGNELSINNKVALTFLWLPLQRQVRIEGFVSKVSETMSDDYFHKRPRGSQLGAIASPQSKKIESREKLEELFDKTTLSLNGTEVLPRPKHWGGYCITPSYFEFWQGRNNRMHDRIFYKEKDGSWELGRLAP